MSFEPIRPALACVALASLAVLAACGPTNNTTSNTPKASHAAASPSDDSDTSSDTSTDTTDSTGGITIGNQVFTSTLQPPSNDVATNANVTQDQNGITLHVAKADTYTYAGLSGGYNGIPQSLAVRVHVAEAAPASQVYYGIACRGFGQNSQYLLLSDANGKWVIIQVKDGNQTVLKQGTADGVDATSGVTIDAACVTPASDDKMNRLVLALNGKVVGSVDDSFENVPISNSFELFAISPDTTTGTGDVIFNRLTVYSASSQ